MGKNVPNHRPTSSCPRMGYTIAWPQKPTVTTSYSRLQFSMKRVEMDTQNFKPCLFIQQLEYVAMFFFQCFHFMNNWVWNDGCHFPFSQWSTIRQPMTCPGGFGILGSTSLAEKLIFKSHVVAGCIPTFVA